MSRINPLDDNPIIETDYLTGEPLEVARQLREVYCQEITVEALHNQDQRINPYIWSHTPCNWLKTNTDFINKKELEKKEEENHFFNFIRRDTPIRPFQSHSENPLLNLRQEEIELPPPRIVEQSRSRQQQRQERLNRYRQQPIREHRLVLFDRNRQNHK
jgi:hypothetical protein